MATVAERAIGGHAGHGDAVVGLDPEPVIVDRVDRRDRDRGGLELLEARARCLADASGNILPPCLVGGDAQRLRGFGLAAVFDEALPPLP